MGPDISPLSLALRGLRDFPQAAQLLTSVALMYVCIAAYFSLFRLRLLNVYQLVPGASDGVSLLLNAALLGRAALASARVLERAQTHPAAGYRFPAFAPHMQDYEPSEDHFANMATALQLMLLAPADDGANASALLFPAWPCAWDVDFKLWAPRRTAVSGKLQDGKLLNFDVQPPERRAAIVVRACQK
jgi:hypothetical protein